MSSPVDIPYRRQPGDAASSLESSPGGLYVPVHKRNNGPSSATNSPQSKGSRISSSSSSRSSSASRSEPESLQQDSLRTRSPSSHPLVYDQDELLKLAHSPRSKILPETRDSLRIAAPEIVMNRKQRKALEYWTTQNENLMRKQQKQNDSQSQSQGQGQQSQKHHRGQSQSQSPKRGQNPSRTLAHYSSSNPFSSSPRRRNQQLQTSGSTVSGQAETATDKDGDDVLSWRGRQLAVSQLTPVAV